MDRNESAVLRGCQAAGAGLAPSWERWAGKGPEAAGNSQPSPRRSICGGHSRPPLKPSPCQAPGCLPFPATRREGSWQRCQELKTNHLGVTHPGRQGLSVPHLIRRVRSCTPVCPSFFLVLMTRRAYMCQIQGCVVLQPWQKMMCYSVLQGSLRKHSPG